MSREFEVPEEVVEAATNFLEAAETYWELIHKHEPTIGAVVWLQSEGGSLAIYTRGEYKDLLKQTVDYLDKSK